MTDIIKVAVTHPFQASAERVYDAWLSPDKARVWLKKAGLKLGLAGDIRQVEIDPVVGGAFLFTDMRDGVEARHWGRYLELDRPNKIVFTWMTNVLETSDPSKVTLTIRPEGEGCVAALVHEMDAQWADYEERTKSGWSFMLQASAEMEG